MSDKEAMELVLKIANRHADDYEEEEEILEAIDQLQDYSNDLMREE